MAREISAYCTDETVAAIDALAREYGVSRREVVRQLVEVGLEHVDGEPGHTDPETERRVQ